MALLSFSEWIAKHHKDAGPIPDNKYSKFVSELVAICDKTNLDARVIGKVGDHELYQVTINPSGSQAILVGATMHGDEPAGAYAVLEYLKAAKFPSKKKIILLPCMNPCGFVNNERFASKGRDLNRQWNKSNPEDEAKVLRDFLKSQRIDFFLSLHEDSESNGFYLYASDKKLKSKWDAMLEMAGKVMPINTDKTIQGSKSDGHGVALVDKDTNRESRSDSSIETWVNNTLGASYLCTETPSKLPLKTRSDLYKKFLNYILD